MAFNTSLTSFEWEALPENSYRRKLLSIGMAGVQNVAASVAVLEGMFVWSLNGTWSNTDADVTYQASSGRICPQTQ